MTKNIDLFSNLSFGFEQTYTIDQWWDSPGFTHISDTPKKRTKMQELASSIASILQGSYIQSTDIWGHIQYEVFDMKKNPSFVVTMDPGSIEVKTPPVTFAFIEDMAEVLVQASEKVGLVPYRTWWYGIKGGTEGGCHVNLGGLDNESNPLIKRPDLVVKYSSYLHNRPWLTYPFMGPDVGTHGNAMRLDEKTHFEKVQEKMNQYIELYKNGHQLTAQETYDFFKETSLVAEKSSAPSLYKFNYPHFLIEDRAQEALRSSKEFKLVAELRLKILEKLLKQINPEQLKDFKHLHDEVLTSYWLWGEFLEWANELGLNPIDYQCFFDRQFPKLLMGTNTPKLFGLKEGRRPRKVTAVQKRGDVIISKTIDTSFKRFEISYYTKIEEQFDFEIDGEGIEYLSPMFRHKGYLGFGETGRAYFKYFDIKYNKENPIITIRLKDKLLGTILETAQFNIQNMMWC